MNRESYKDTSYKDTEIVWVVDGSCYPESSDYDSILSNTIPPKKPFKFISDTELHIRREVMDAVDEMIACEADEEEYYKGKLLKIKDRLNLLWGE